ncbi:MAG: BolA family transcriptional regulator [Gammaproteobacteria bacterium]|nr:BolA family transcriptional regulator [Gammaproteobacteria bacterium]
MNLTRKKRIESILNEKFKPEFCEVINESYLHRVPEHAETHFKVIVISTAFEGLSRIHRHRMVNQSLASELESGLHALSLSLYSLIEWQHNPGIIPSPKCAHQ